METSSGVYVDTCKAHPSLLCEVNLGGQCDLHLVGHTRAEGSPAAGHGCRQDEPRRGGLGAGPGVSEGKETCHCRCRRSAVGSQRLSHSLRHQTRGTNVLDAAQ